MKFDFSILWKSVKTPLRQGLFFAYALLINKVFDLLASTVGFDFTEEQRIQILSFGTPIVWSILSFIDKFMHETNKELPVKKQNDGLLGATGLSGF